jgi:hypothetical protein
VARHLLIALIVVCLVAMSGCLRLEFDLCDDPDPPPECGLDAGADAGIDGGPDGG